MRTVPCALSVLLVLGSLSAAEPSAAQNRAMMVALMRMELGGQVVAEAQKMSSLKEVAAAAERHRSVLMGVARKDLVAAFPSAEVAQPVFAAFVDAVNAKPADFTALRGEVARERAAERSGRSGNDRHFSLYRKHFIHIILFFSSLRTTAIIPSTCPRASIRPWKL